jgi:hypothetical protein
MIKQYFGSSIIWTLIALVGAFVYGTETAIGENAIVAGFTAMLTVAILGVLEVSLSFDNAIVNAKILKDMSDVWKHRFLTWGMIIAVFGMRLVFPIVIVSLSADISMWETLKLATTSPSDYQHHLEDAHTAIMGFGGTFLFMVALKYFIDEDKDVHWIEAIESKLTILGKIEAIQAALALGAVILATSFILKQHGLDEAFIFAKASIFGLIVYILIDGIGAFFGDDNLAGKTGGAAFIYLELLDASFSFDGVIGAFALSNSIFIIAMGLGIGALFVRSLTILMVAKGTLDQFRYLEHGAFYSIIALASIMFIDTIYEVPEIVTGGLSAGFIGLAVWASIRYNHLNAGEEAII